MAVASYRMRGCRGVCCRSREIFMPARRPMPRRPVRVEHVFGTQAQMGGHIVRTIGLVRAAVKIGLMNLAYNMKRLGQLVKYGAKSVSSYPKPICRIGAPITA